VKTATRRLVVALAVAAAPSALASGREGEQYAVVVLVIIVATLVTFAACMVAGLVVGVTRARRAGEPALKGVASGGLKGLVYFVVVGSAATVGASVLSALWIGFAVVVAPTIGDDCTVKGEPIQWAADYCMLKMQTDDEIAVSGCIDEEMKKAPAAACDRTAHFKRGMCEAMIGAGTRGGTVPECVDDPAFKGRTVEAGGVGGPVRPERRREAPKSKGYSGSSVPDPPISFGKSFCFGSPSLIASTFSP
jgi:hypothetical protein